MGLDAFVRCNCFEEGKIKPLPIPKELIYLSENGNYEVEWGAVDNETYFTYIEWLETCCEHPNMEYTSARIANWSGYRLFQDALGKVGWEYFPTLREELPNANDGHMSAEKAAKALVELECFKNYIEQLEKIVLINSDTDEIIREYIASYDGVFILSPQYRCGFDRDGFFIMTNQKEKSTELFRARRVEQRILKDSHIELIDMDTNKSFIWDHKIEDYYGNHFPRYMHVAIRKRSVEDFTYILEPLSLVLHASVETGNPVCWT